MKMRPITIIVIALTTSSLWNSNCCLMSLAINNQDQNTSTRSVQQANEPISREAAELSSARKQQADRLPFVQVSEQQKYQIVTDSLQTASESTQSALARPIAKSRDATTATCKLGNDTYQVGDKWNPNLPPHGIQVCVLCECIARQQSEKEMAKVNCRRTAKDCPQIDSCPFGEKPVAPPGQCCKVCLSHNILGEGPVKPSSTVPMSSGIPQEAGQLPSRHKNKPANATTAAATAATEEQQGKLAETNVTTVVVHHHQQQQQHRANKHKIGGLRPSNKELNTKDSKLAFKSLESRNKFTIAGEEQSQLSDKDLPAGDSSPSICKLGNDTYTIGDSWKPNLPPFGVQVCVLCECVARLRKSCYEAKVTCRRIANECPVIESCPDGKAPVTAPGQCCKSCPSLADQMTTTTTTTTTEMTTPANFSESLTNGSYIMSNESSTHATSVETTTKSTIKSRSVTHFDIKDLPLCKRDGSDVGISKRSRGSTVKQSTRGETARDKRKKNATSSKKKEKKIDQMN